MSYCIGDYERETPTGHYAQQASIACEHFLFFRYSPNCNLGHLIVILIEAALAWKKIQEIPIFSHLSSQ